MLLREVLIGVITIVVTGFAFPFVVDIPFMFLLMLLLGARGKTIVDRYILNGSID